ncbi:potassium/proton antiporter [Rhodoflexus sp.]
MYLTTENILLIGSLLLFLSILGGSASYRFGVPTLVLFLAIGMLAGSDGLGGIYFDNPKTAQFIGIVSLNFILFSGGLDTDWQSTKPILWHGFSLSTIGVFLTAFTLGVFVWSITDFTLFEGLLLGAIVSSTDAAAVFSILRSKSLALKGNLRPVLELESGSNDPMAYILTIIFLSLATNPQTSVWSVVPMFFAQMLLGTGSGYAFGRLTKYLVNHIRLDFEGLYPVLVITMMLVTFSATDFIGGNGFLAVYLCAVYLGNQDLIHKKTILRMFDGLAWLMQIVLFLTLGLLVFPTHVVPVIGVGFLIALFLMFVARPLSVWIALLPFRMPSRHKWYISWVGLRGAVPIVFATYPMLAGIDKADMIFNLVFFISLTSVLLQGTTLPIVAKWLNVNLPVQVRPLSRTDTVASDVVKTVMERIEISADSPVVGKQLVDLAFPPEATIAMIIRNETFITPNGATELQPGDSLVVLCANRQHLARVFDCLQLSKPMEQPL